MQLLADNRTVWEFPACEPGRSRLCKLDVVRWWKRAPTATRPITVPSDLKLAILARPHARAVPRGAMARQNGAWDRQLHHVLARRLPPDADLLTLLAEVDVTVELFAVLPRMRASLITFILGRYLRQRHATEVPNCTSRFLFAWDGVTTRRFLEDKLSSDCPVASLSTRCSPPTCSFRGT